MPERDVFDAIASPIRRSILDRLRGGPHPVRDLSAGFEVTRPAVSQHLGVLRDAGLVAVERVGREHLYGLRAEPLQRVDAWVAAYERFWRQRLRALEELLDEEP